MSMYVKQKLRVVFNRVSSEWFCVSNGVKQGGVLSPTLFGVYVDGLLDTLKQKGIGCHVGDVFCGGLGYADDLILLVPTFKGLNGVILVCENYASEFNILSNGKKSQLMVIGKRDVNINVYVSGEKVETVSKIKYLGNIVTDNINDSLV